MIKQEKQLMFYIRDSTHSIKCWHRIALYQSKRKQKKTKQEVINVYLIKVERRRVYHDVERKSPVIFFSRGAKTLVYRKVCKTPPCFSTRLPRDGIWWQKKNQQNKLEPDHHLLPRYYFPIFGFLLWRWDLFSTFYSKALLNLSIQIRKKDK